MSVLGDLGKVTLKHTKTTKAEDEDWQRDLIYLKGAQTLTSQPYSE
jgi:hypothetical protein